jgi:hypothetical protein
MEKNEGEDEGGAEEEREGEQVESRECVDVVMLCLCVDEEVQRRGEVERRAQRRSIRRRAAH